MDNELRREFRAYKAETEDRLKRLEDAQDAASEQQAASATAAPPTGKKGTADAPTGDTVA